MNVNEFFSEYGQQTEQMLSETADLFISLIKNPEWNHLAVDGDSSIIKSRLQAEVMKQFHINYMELRTLGMEKLDAESFVEFHKILVDAFFNWNGYLASKVKPSLVEAGFELYDYGAQVEGQAGLVFVTKDGKATDFFAGSISESFGSGSYQNIIHAFVLNPLVIHKRQFNDGLFFSDLEDYFTSQPFEYGEVLQTVRDKYITELKSTVDSTIDHLVTSIKSLQRIESDTPPEFDVDTIINQEMSPGVSWKEEFREIALKSFKAIEYASKTFHKKTLYTGQHQKTLYKAEKETDVFDTNSVGGYILQKLFEAFPKANERASLIPNSPTDATPDEILWEGRVDTEVFSGDVIFVRDYILLDLLQRAPLSYIKENDTKENGGESWGVGGVVHFNEEEEEEFKSYYNSIVGFDAFAPEVKPPEVFMVYAQGVPENNLQEQIRAIFSYTAEKLLEISNEPETPSEKAVSLIREQYCRARYILLKLFPLRDTFLVYSKFVHAMFLKWESQQGFSLYDVAENLFKVEGGDLRWLYDLAFSNNSGILGPRTGTEYERLTMGEVGDFKEENLGYITGYLSFLKKYGVSVNEYPAALTEYLAELDVECRAAFDACMKKVEEFRIREYQPDNGSVVYVSESNDDEVEAFSVFLSAFLRAIGALRKIISPEDYYKGEYRILQISLLNRYLSNSGILRGMLGAYRPVLVEKAKAKYPDYDPEYIVDICTGTLKLKTSSEYYENYDTITMLKDIDRKNSFYMPSFPSFDYSEQILIGESRFSSTTPVEPVEPVVTPPVEPVEPAVTPTVPPVVTPTVPPVVTPTVPPVVTPTTPVVTPTTPVVTPTVPVVRPVVPVVSSTTGTPSNNSSFANQFVDAFLNTTGLKSLADDIEKTIDDIQDALDIPSLSDVLTPEEIENFNNQEISDEFAKKMNDFIDRAQKEFVYKSHKNDEFANASLVRNNKVAGKLIRMSRSAIYLGSEIAQEITNVVYVVSKEVSDFIIKEFSYRGRLVTMIFVPAHSEEQITDKFNLQNILQKAGSNRTSTTTATFKERYDKIMKAPLVKRVTSNKYFVKYIKDSKLAQFSLVKFIFPSEKQD